MTLFISSTLNKVDRKGRCSLPAAYRSAVEAAETRKLVYIYPALNEPCLEAGGESHFKQLMDTIYAGGPSLREDPKKLARRILSQAEPVSWDGDGRIVLSQKLRDAGQITNEASFMGLGHSFQIWAPDVYEGYDPDDDRAFLDIQERLEAERHG